MFCDGVGVAAAPGVDPARETYDILARTLSGSPPYDSDKEFACKNNRPVAGAVHFALTPNVTSPILPVSVGSVRALARGTLRITLSESPL